MKEKAGKGKLNHLLLREYFFILITLLISHLSILDMSPMLLFSLLQFQPLLKLFISVLFQYAGSKSLPLNYTSMAETFYSQSLSSLSSWGRGLNLEVNFDLTTK